MRTITALRHLPALLALAFAALLGLNYSIALARNEKSAAPPKDKWDYAALTNVPEGPRAKRNPLENDPNAVAAGGKLYEEHCAECHGMKGEGGRKGANLRVPEMQQANPGAVFWILTNGVVRHGMPVWSKLPEPERWQIVTFLRTFRAAAAPQSPTEPK